MKVDLIKLVIDCPHCPEHSVALEPAAYKPLQGFRVEGVCQCGTALAANITVANLRYSPPTPAPKDEHILRCSRCGVVCGTTVSPAPYFRCTACDTPAPKDDEKDGAK